MKLVKCIIRPNRLEEVREALSKLNVSGMTVSEVRGHGRQKGHKAIYRGREYSVTLLPKMMIEMVLPDDLVDEVLKVITETARTGEGGWIVDPQAHDPHSAMPITGISRTEARDAAAWLYSR